MEVIVEHFRANVAGLLEGHAKAMIVTDSRLAAVRYKIEIDRYIKAHRYTIVAFSGSLDDPENGLSGATEASMNDGLGSDPAHEFRRGDLRVHGAYMNDRGLAWRGFGAGGSLSR